MSELEYHQQIVGRVIAHLIDNGLKRIDLDAGDAFPIMEETHGDEEDALKEFFDVLHWMKSEGLIRVDSVQPVNEYSDVFNGVQLTAKALNGIKAPQENLGGESIEKTVANKEGLSGDTYHKIADALGGFVAGIAKGFGNG